MKKLLGLAVAAVSALALMSCASGGASVSSGAPYTIKSGDGVIGYYTFDDASDDSIPDVSGNGADVFSMALDGISLVDGVEGKALNFNGEDEYIEIDSELLAGKGVTIAAWVNPSSWKDWARVFDIGNCTEDAWCGMDFNTKMLRMDVIGAAGAVSILSPLPPVNTWTHIAATFGDGKAALYVNGKLAQKLTCPVTSANIGATAQGIYIGRSNWADPLYNGAMDNVLVANRILSDAEIASVYAGVKVEE